MEPKPRRQIFGSLAALFTAPLFVDRKALVEAVLPAEEKAPSQPLPTILPPAQSVKRRD